MHVAKRGRMQTVLMLRDAGEADVVHDSLRDLGYEIVHAREPHNLCTAVAQLDPYVIVVTTRSPTDDLLACLAEVTRTCPRPVVMFANDGKRELIRRAVQSGVCAYVVDGWAPERLTPIIEAAVARFEAHDALRKELVSTRAKLSDRKVIEKAKGIVMQQRKLSEDDAYAALRKMAMDQNLALGEVARRVITVAELLA
jgi:response regulator NasT